jgi:hypothetical protein
MASPGKGPRKAFRLTGRSIPARLTLISPKTEELARQWVAGMMPVQSTPRRIVRHRLTEISVIESLR